MLATQGALPARYSPVSASWSHPEMTLGPFSGSEQFDAKPLVPISNGLDDKPVPGAPPGDQCDVNGIGGKCPSLPTDVTDAAGYGDRSFTQTLGLTGQTHGTILAAQCRGAEMKRGALA
jgi:hypothetical protein